MLRLKKVAVTGGLSCGKSSVCQFFKEFGAYVVNADEISHQLLSPHTKVGQDVVALMGSLDREKIAKKVFDDLPLLRKLEAILHPPIREAIEKAYKSCTGTLFVAEVPLLFEAGWEKDFDAIVVVDADPLLCQMRFQASRKYPPGEYERRMARQLSQEEKKKKATFIIENQGSLEDLKQTTKMIYQSLLEESVN